MTENSSIGLNKKKCRFLVGLICHLKGERKTRFSNENMLLKSVFTNQVNRSVNTIFSTFTY